MIKIKFLISILKSYKKKLIKIFFFEIYYSIKYLLSGNYYKIQNDNLRTDTIPCPYFFIQKISQFKVGVLTIFTPFLSILKRFRLVKHQKPQNFRARIFVSG